MSTLDKRASRWSLTQWLIVFIAALGFAFDTYELLMAPLILKPAIVELTGAAPNSPEFAMWRGRIFYLPAFAGGVFGLLGGYLTDRLGRRRVLTWSILLYAFSAFAAGYSTSIEMLLVMRSLTFIGVCVEFVAAVAWLAELFPAPAEREKVLGYTQAFSSFGGLGVAAVNGLILILVRDGRLPAIVLPSFLSSWLGHIGAGHEHEAWRYTLMSGVIPAIPLIVIRPFLPESPIWAAKRAAGVLKRPSILELFAPRFRRTTIVTTLLFACSYGAAFGAIQQIPQIVGGLPEVKTKVSGMPVPKQKETEQMVASDVTKFQEVGGLLGRFMLALLAAKVISRQRLLRMFQGPALIVLPFVFAVLAVRSLTLLYGGIFLAGFFVVAQFSFWGNYLPRVYPVHLRGTGESFAANIGGRMIGTSFAWVASILALQIPGDLEATTKMAYAAAIIAILVCGLGFVASFWLPEPLEDELPE